MKDALRTDPTAPSRRWHRGKLGRSPSIRHCRISGWIALQAIHKQRP